MIVKVICMRLYDVFQRMSIEGKNNIPLENNTISTTSNDMKQSPTFEELLSRIADEFSNHDFKDIMARCSITTDVSEDALFWSMCNEVIRGQMDFRCFCIHTFGDDIEFNKSTIISELEAHARDSSMIMGFFHENRFIGCCLLSDYIKADSDSWFKLTLFGEDRSITHLELIESLDFILTNVSIEFRRRLDPESIKLPTVEFPYDAQLLGIDSLMFLIIDCGGLPSVKHLVDVYPYKNKEDQIVLSSLIHNIDTQTGDCIDPESLIEFFGLLWKTSVGEDKAFKFISMLQNVLDDYRVNAPLKRHMLNEGDFTMISPHDYECEVCGENIEISQEAYFRPSPAKAIRHLKCNGKVRYSHEYAFIDYLIKEIEFFESSLNHKENCDYYLDGDLKHTAFTRMGFITDDKKKIVRLPHFTEFVMDYSSGESDYDLMMKYRPYHVYLEFLFEMKGISIENLVDMGGYKYLMRERLGRDKYRILSNKLDNIHESEMFWDESTFNVVDSEVKKVVYSAIIRRIFTEMGILHDSFSITYDGRIMSYSVNEIDGSDLFINMDAYGLYCTDSVSSEPFIDYFQIDSEVVKSMVDYLSSFEVKQ